MNTPPSDVLSRSDAVALTAAHVNTGLARFYDLVGAPLEVRSEGCLIYDEHDRPFLSCGGFGPFILGHGHPRVVQAALDQLRRHTQSIRTLLNPYLANAARSLAEAAP